MNDINFSLQIKKSNTDEWYTPVEPVKMIVPYLKRAGYHKILCPFDKAGSNFVRVLKKEGFDVTYSHIETGTDFFDIKICVIMTPLSATRLLAKGKRSLKGYLLKKFLLR